MYACVAARGGQTGRTDWTGTPRTGFLTARNRLNTGRFETGMNQYWARAEYGLRNKEPNRHRPETAETRGTGKHGTVEVHQNLPA